MASISEFVGVDKWHEAVVSVIVGDDVAYWRRQLIVALEQSPTIEVMAEVENAEQLVSAVSEAAPDVVWMGLHLPGPGAARLTDAIREVVPSVRVVVVANPEEAELRSRALRSGAVGIVARAAATEIAVGVTEQVAWGHAVLEPEDVDHLLETYAGFERQATSLQQQLAPPTIDERDRRILARLARGDTADEAASELGISAATVSQVLAQAVARLHRHTRAEAVVYAAGEQLFDAG